MSEEIFLNGPYWWPRYDHAPDKCLRKVRLHMNDMHFAADLCKSKRVCVQAGGHAGVWAIQLARLFDAVYTFEPERVLYHCLQLNCASVPRGQNIIGSQKALGPEIKQVKFKSHPSAGSWRVREDGDFTVDQITIDSLNLPHCDAIFLDIESYEIPALRGAWKTISKFKPVLHVEILKDDNQKMREYMASIGYEHRHQVNSDHVFTAKK